MKHTSATVAQNYASLLKAAITETETPVRSLAKQLAEQRHTKLESERRALRRIMKGESTPEPDKAEQIAAILGRPELADPPGRKDRLADLERRVEEAERLARASILGRLAEATPEMFRGHPDEIRRLVDSIREVAALLEAGVEEFSDGEPRTG